ncbi:5-oxoprolinase subunit PxpB [Zunongwangia atlantica]|uniref:Allophanate hydrolase subunit 1 n=1 Tax=Zunongwangia atlantica 22II14-10F7 TaxID=1185767 RepID=A0A1Y1T7C8_9FLAO|nr:5-oxoprolinase subunit PxpB [Zunongwangia atlantica]ORL46956.1 allophanate hydrolase subunit 1 [Zunongwangia atlantica 22II14-10F7]
MSKELPHISQLGDNAILIQFEKIISEKVLDEVLFYKNLIQQLYIKQKVEVINTYNSILINYFVTIEDVYSDLKAVKEVFQQNNNTKNINSRVFEIPVCYDLDFGIDLELISKEKNLEISEIISLHTKPEYRVYFMGFLPGFLYLGGLDKKLQISRKSQPRMKIEKGAVGIGENQTGIYPKVSPGGWQIIGNCPVNFFDKNCEIPTQISAGDYIKFKSVDRAEYDRIKEQVNQGNFQLKKQDRNG